MAVWLVSAKHEKSDKARTWEITTSETDPQKISAAFELRNRNFKVLEVMLKELPE